MKTSQHQEHIINLACAQFQITRQEITSACRAQRLVIPRWIAMKVIRSHCPELTFTQIAQPFGKCPSAVVHAIQLLNGRIENEPRIAAAVMELEEAMDSSVSSVQSVV